MPEISTQVYRVCSALHTILVYIGPVTSLDYSLDGKLYTTSSKDGCIKVGGVLLVAHK